MLNDPITSMHYYVSKKLGVFKMPEESKQPQVNLLFKTNQCQFHLDNFSALRFERHISGGSGGVYVLRFLQQANYILLKRMQ